MRTIKLLPVILAAACGSKKPETTAAPSPPPIEAPHAVPVTTNAEGVAVHAGDTIDFVVDLRGTQENDDFTWTVDVKLNSAERGSHAAGDDVTSWNSAATFRKPRATPLGIWARYAQVLLMSNEFVFVD